MNYIPEPTELDLFFDEFIVYHKLKLNIKLKRII